MKANADAFTIERWFIGDDRRPVYRVNWEQAWADERDEQEERQRDFRSLDAALRWGARLMAASAELSRKP